MKQVVHVNVAKTRIPLARERVAAIARAVLRAHKAEDAVVSITFVTPPRIAALNRQHLAQSGPTDVIAFTFARHRPGDPIVGDIYIAPHVARRNARERRLSVREELSRLVVHGVLHTLGFDHPSGDARTASRMWQRQESLLRALGVIPAARGRGATVPRRRRRGATAA
jgi:probable rRNA maturation factor